MTANKEDYIKEIYKLGGNEELVSNKAIARILEIAPSSVTEMIIKLQKDELIIYEPYKGSRLTAKGISLAISLLRGHRLWEVFLIRHLGYSWMEAHEDAELLEHMTPTRLVDRLEQFLEYPSFCPHGSGIPNIDGIFPQVTLQLIIDASIGCMGIISKVEEEEDLLNYLQEKSINIGDTIRILKKEPYEGPITLLLHDTEIMISYKAASQLYIKL